MEAAEKPPPVSAKRRAWLKKLFSPGETLSQRVVRGGFWVFALRIVTRLFGLVRTVVLARLLAPEDFGLFGIALLTMSALETFSQTGFQAALIQKKEDIKPYLDTAWTLQAIRGVALALILFGIAPYVGMFFATPAAAGLVRVLGISALFQGFSNIGVVYFQKEMEFHKQFLFQLSGTLVDLFVAITAAVLLRNAWALILGLLAGNLVRMMASYLIYPYRPRLELEGAKAKELYTFGRWILGSSIFLFLLNEGDDVFVGKILGVTSLGLYQLAYGLSNLPATEITNIVSQVSFPAYSKLQDRSPQLRQAYLQVLLVTSSLTFPLAGGIAFLAPEFTQIFLGDKWLPMVPTMQVLTIWGLIRSIGATTGPVFSAVGRPDIVTKLTLVKLLFLAALIYPMTQAWGILGTALAVVLSAIINNPIADYLVIKTTRCSVKDFLQTLAYPFIGTVLMLGGMFAVRGVSDSTTVLFILSIVTGSIVYFLAMVAFRKFFNHRIIKVLSL